MSKSELRKKFRESRQTISLEYRQQAAEAAAYHFSQSEIFKQAENIGCYFPFGDEFNSLPVVEAIWQASKNCYLPILTDENKLEFRAYKKNDVLKKNRYQIPEPVAEAKSISLEQLNLVIAPLVAFDLQGHRLGTGGGYYDRTFGSLSSSDRPIILGLAYAAQQAYFLPSDEWDVNLDGVITEHGIMIIN